MTNEIPVLLLDEPVLTMHRSLIRVLGDHESAAFVQQVHFRSRISPVVDGHRWAVATTDEWCADIVLTVRQLRRVVSHLTEIGVLISVQPGSYDRTAWRRIDHAALKALAPMIPHTDVSGPCIVQSNPTTETSPSIDTETSPSMDTKRDVLPIPRKVRETKNRSNSLSLVADQPATVNQEAKRICDGYWKWYKDRHGTDPLNGFNAYRGIVAKALKAGHEQRAVKDAMIVMHDAGVPLSGEALDRQLTRPSASRVSRGAAGYEGLGFTAEMAAHLRDTEPKSHAEMLQRARDVDAAELVALGDGR